MTDLDEIERLLAKATEGPWQHHMSHVYGPDPMRTLVCQFRNGPWLVSDRDLVVALRNAAPAMIAELKALRHALEYLNSFGCPKCGGDCSSANPPVMMCPMLETKAALHPSRRAAAMSELIASTADEYGVQNNGTD